MLSPWLGDHLPHYYHCPCSLSSFQTNSIHISQNIDQRKNEEKEDPKPSSASLTPQVLRWIYPSNQPYQIIEK